MNKVYVFQEGKCQTLNSLTELGIDTSVSSL